MNSIEYGLDFTSRLYDLFLHRINLLLLLQQTFRESQMNILTDSLNLRLDVGRLFLDTFKNLQTFENQVDVRHLLHGSLSKGVKEVDLLLFVSNITNRLQLVVNLLELVAKYLSSFTHRVSTPLRISVNSVPSSRCLRGLAAMRVFLLLIVVFDLLTQQRDHREDVVKLLRRVPLANERFNTVQALLDLQILLDLFFSKVLICLALLVGKYSVLS